jgi:hypothetical protein
MRNATHQLKVAGFCLSPVVLNWYFFCWGPHGYTKTEFGPIVSALVTSVLLAIWLVFSVWRKRRAGRRLGLHPQQIRWGRACLPAIYFIPLLFRFDYHSSWVESTGMVTNQVVHYGHARLSPLLFAIAAACLVLFQMRAKYVYALKTET